eukprot:jgi/Botrbrau1/10851/Bobra.0025s0029.1
MGSSDHRVSLGFTVSVRKRGGWGTRHYEKQKGLLCPAAVARNRKEHRPHNDAPTS